MKIPGLSSYSEEQIQKVRDFSSSFSAYLRFVSQKSETTLASSLRVRRHKAWLECVCAEFFQTAETEDICRYWSLAADQILQAVCQESTGFPIALFAYGKLGSSELNLSSDVDLVFVSIEDTPPPPHFLRKFQELVQHPTELGFCFRTDFDLRPGGRMGPLIPTEDQFMDYYGNYGEAWERLAFVRLRPIWGNAELVERVLKFTSKFSFRKHLDYTLLSDLQSLRQRIHSQYGHRTQSNQIDLKLGVGGIRDLELFVHALQVVHGGRDENLRQRGTSEALSALESKSVLPSSEVQFLKSHYWKLRRWENLVQAENDQQTHLLKKDFVLNPPFAELQADMERCDRLVSGLLGKVDLQTRTLPETSEEQMQWLQKLGYNASLLSQVWPEILSTTALSRQRERDENYRLRFLYLFLTAIAQFPQSQNRSLMLLRDFLKATRAKATFYSLFLNQENLIEQLARIFSISPYLASLLCSRPELIDSYVYRTQSTVSMGDPQSFLDSLSERKLLSELINGSDFLNTLDLGALTTRMTETADQIANDLLRLVKSETDSDLHVLALGKWSGQELGLRSDLDFIFVTPGEVTEKHLKAARKFFHRLTETHHRGGSLYSIDMRLKPSGKGGLVVSSFEQLSDYLGTQAAAWERQAYLRSRFIQGDLPARELQKICVERGLNEIELQELNEIRQALLKNASVGAGEIDLKYGEGGLVDMELATQAGLLKENILSNAKTTDQMKTLGWNELVPLYEFMRLVEQIFQTVVVASGSTLSFDSESFDSIASVLRESKENLGLRLRSALNDSQQLLKRLDPRRSHF